jgi:cytochrome c oxidase cbb3-type subunit 3
MIKKLLYYTATFILFQLSSTHALANDLVQEVPYSFEETVERTKEVLSSSNYRVFNERYLEQGFADDNDINKKQITLRFCNFNILDDALKLEPDLGVLLPCKLTIIETPEGQVKIIRPRVKGLSKLFQNEKLEKYEDAIEESYSEIIDEVTI